MKNVNQKAGCCPYALAKHLSVKKSGKIVAYFGVLTDVELQVNISAENMLACCHECGFGCNGGYPLAAWNYWVG